MDPRTAGSHFHGAHHNWEGDLALALSIPALDTGREQCRIIGFIRSAVEETGVRGVVLGLSGGGDSSG
ncbi:MAG: hypothetical protein QXE79_01915, partial [Candidatus Bathyarchaeia archaeon]